MNDVSLTQCFLNDLQSPEKPNRCINNQLVHMLNENSRDSIFFNVSLYTLYFYIIIFGFKWPKTFTYFQTKDGHHNGHSASRPGHWLHLKQLNDWQIKSQYCCLTYSVFYFFLIDWLAFGKRSDLVIDHILIFYV